MIRYLPFVSTAGGGGGGEPHGLLFFYGIYELAFNDQVPMLDPETKRTEFLSYLGTVENEPFDGFSLGASTTKTITRNGSTCTVSRLITAWDGGFTDISESTATNGVSISNSTAAQRWNTSSTSDRWLDSRIDPGIDAGAPSGLWEGRLRVQFSFATNVAAFGFYGTDFGDFVNFRAIQARITDADDVETVHEITDNTEHQGGNLIFWGFVDDLQTYKKVIIEASQVGGDSDGFEGLGFDDVVFCTPDYLA